VSGITPGFAAWKLAFGISLIIFVGGIAGNMLGGMLPIVSITQAVDFAAGVLTGATTDLGLDDFFAQYEPTPGGTLADYDFGTYPFANQAVAANAIIMNPLSFSLLMICPVKGNENYLSHLAVMTALRAVIAQHASLGGTFTVATPKQIYTNCLLSKLSDVSAADTKQPQMMYQWDFVQPLVTLQQAQGAQNALMQKFSNGTQISGQPQLSGAAPAVGAPFSLATPPTVPAATPLQGAGAVSTGGGS